MTRSSIFSRLNLALLVILIALQASPAAADTKTYNDRPVQRANHRLGKAALRQRTRVIRQARTQRIKPAAHKAMTKDLLKAKPGTAEYRTLAGKTSLQARAQAFIKTSEKAGTPVTTFTRRLRGLLKVGKRNKVSHHSKTFVEVTEANFAAFSQTMGQNTVWFAVNDSPGHLHTLAADQGDKGRMWHNVYGVKSDPAGLTGNMTQYAMGVHLTDGEMDRFVRYFNAGMKHGYDPAGYGDSGTDGKATVYGFYNSKGEKVGGKDNIKCTNWVTSAPIGALPRWAKTIDKRLVKLTTEGKLKNVSELNKAGGLHAALAGAKDAAARQDIVARVLGNKMSKWNRSAVKRMGKAFTRQLTDFPNRPTDLVLRGSMAETFGVNRSQDPAKWSYDLLMSKRVPVIAVMNKTADPGLKGNTFKWEIMGNISPTGQVVPGSHYGTIKDLGVIPARSQAPTPNDVPATPAQ